MTLADRPPGKRETKGDVEKVESTVAREKAFVDAQEARVIAVQKNDGDNKSAATQTSTILICAEEKNSRTSNLKNLTNSSSSCIYLDQQKSSSFWSADDEPAPQWLIEEALKRSEDIDVELAKEQWTKNETITTETEYESIISELESKLGQAKAELEEAERTKSIIKEKYRRTLENAKANAYKENELLQEKILQICTTVLENFGPRATSEKRRNDNQTKSHSRLKCYEKISNKLRKQLRTAVAKSNRLKCELIKMKKALDEKSEKYESTNSCFLRLKQEMENTEVNLNGLIAENVSLRKKIEGARELIEVKIGKEQQEKSNVQFRDAQRSRELTNLRKKTKEDFATIAELRNKLLRSESANANKGFLLNSYKGQLDDLNKENCQFATKVTSLENEINCIRNNNAQLKAKVSLLSIDKEKLLLVKKSRTDMSDKTETQSEESLRELDMKTEREEAAKMLKMNAVENQNTEYFKAIKEFLKKIYDHHESRELEKSLGSEAGEREARETACNILNMTPEELTGFIKGKTPNSNNPWLSELSRITSRNNFSESLSKFLFKKAVKKVKT